MKCKFSPTIEIRLKEDQVRMVAYIIREDAEKKYDWFYNTCYIIFTFKFEKLCIKGIASYQCFLKKCRDEVFICSWQ
jgi:hypothetical protein